VSDYNLLCDLGYNTPGLFFVAYIYCEYPLVPSGLGNIVIDIKFTYDIHLDCRRRRCVSSARSPEAEYLVLVPKRRSVLFFCSNLRRCHFLRSHVVRRTASRPGLKLGHGDICDRFGVLYE
jgi:hypothetical protein